MRLPMKITDGWEGVAKPYAAKRYASNGAGRAATGLTTITFDSSGYPSVR